MIAEKTGWDYDKILWGVSWANIRMMLDDAPALKKVKKKKKTMLGSDLIKELGL